MLGARCRTTTISSSKRLTVIYPLELSRYVVLNPVRAAVVKHTRQWKWSSYHATIDKDLRPEWLHVDWLLSQLGHQRNRRVERYSEFVQQGVRSSSVWENLRGQVYLGSDEFVEAMQNRLAEDAKLSHREIPRMRRRALAKSLTYYQEQFDDPKQGMIAAYATGDYTLQTIADAFGVHYSTVSRTINGK